MGADRLATGHYARISLEDGRHRLLKGVDQSKDQSYFLYMLGQAALGKAAFPLGSMSKAEVRQRAMAAGLAVAQKKGSTGICFIGERNFKAFLQRYMPAQPGEMRSLDEKNMGSHDGLMYYTPGQRKGLGIGGQGNGEPWFVVRKDLENNVLYVSQGEPPELFASRCRLVELHFIAGEPPAARLDCMAKVRYRQADQRAAVEICGGEAVVEFETPQRAMAPGQSVVFYSGDACMGGGVIDAVG